MSNEDAGERVWESKGIVVSALIKIWIGTFEK